MIQRREFMRLAACGAAGLLAARRLRGQAGVTVSTAGDSGSQVAAPAKGYYPFSGVSGAGRPLTAASATGGWHSGSAGIAYEGPYPPPYPTLPWNNYATGSAVRSGLLPPIRPLLEVHVRDTIVCLGGDGHYYMTGSTGDNIWAFNDGVELWRSPDLKKWHYMGLVWSIEKDGTWEKQWRTLHDKPSRAVWAPEIHFVRGNYFICLSMAPSGISILKSKSGRPEGPYIHVISEDKPIAGGIDPTLFEDDDGKVYFTNGPASRITRLKEDLSAFAEEPRQIVLSDPDHNPAHHAQKCPGRGMNDLGHEGAVLFKANGTYYLGAADEYEGRYSTCVAMSDNIYGPYHTRHESVPCAGGTGFFKDKKGQWWTSYFGNDSQSPFIEKPAILRVDFDSDGKIMAARDKPSVHGAV